LTVNYSVPANGILKVNVNADANLTGPVGAELKLVGGQGFIAYSVGQTSDGLSVTEDYGIPAS
jgi:hypothetical protein